MRWLFLLLTVGSVVLFFSTESASTMGWAMLAFFVFGFGAVLTFAQARIESTSQPHASMLTSRDVQTLRQQGLQKKVANSKSRQHGAVGGAGAGYAGSGMSHKSSNFDHSADSGGSGGDGGSD
jgi:hypothetical protein